VTSQAFTFLTRLNSERSAALADLVITPELTDISTGSFGRSLWRSTAERTLREALSDRLAGYAIPEDEWARNTGRGGSSRRRSRRCAKCA
jgi:hypothetical protein